MKKITISFALLLLFVLSGVLAAQNTRQPRQPVSMRQSRFTKGRAVFRKTGFNFGKIPRGARVAKKFYLVNEGIDTLEVIDIKPG